MASFVHIDYSSEHPGVNRASEAARALKSAFRRVEGSSLVLMLLALVGAPIHAVAAKTRVALTAWAEKRRQAAEDDKLWRLALTDARVMAELSRAMSSDAARDIRHYY